MKVSRDSHNHELSNTLVDHLYASKLKLNGQFMVIDITKSIVKLANILLTSKENNEDNVTTEKKNYTMVDIHIRVHKKDAELKINIFVEER